MSRRKSTRRRQISSAIICAPISKILKSGCGKAAGDLEFEEAARLRDEIRKLEQQELGLPPDQHHAPVKGRSMAGAPATRATRLGKAKMARAPRRSRNLAIALRVSFFSKRPSVFCTAIGLL